MSWGITRNVLVTENNSEEKNYELLKWQRAINFILLTFNHRVKQVRRKQDNTLPVKSLCMFFSSFAINAVKSTYYYKRLPWFLTSLQTAYVC